MPSGRWSKAKNAESQRESDKCQREYNEQRVNIWEVIVSEALRQQALEARVKAQEYLNEKYSALFSPRVAG